MLYYPEGLRQDQSPLFSKSSNSLLNPAYSNAAVIADVTSANGVARVTPLSPSSILKTYIAGISTTPFLMIDRIKEDLLLPAAWKMVLAIKDSAHRGAAKAMTLRNLVPNSTEAGSLMKKVMNCRAKTLKKIVQQIV